MGFFRPARDEYSDACFKVYLLYRSDYSGMRDGESLDQARAALELYWNQPDHLPYFRLSNRGKQVKRVKKQLYAARNQIAREAQYGEWSPEELAKYAIQGRQVVIFGVNGDSDADLIVRGKMDLLEQVAVLEVCDELGIGLFDEAG